MLSAALCAPVIILGVLKVGLTKHLTAQLVAGSMTCVPYAGVLKIRALPFGVYINGPQMLSNSRVALQLASNRS